MKLTEYYKIRVTELWSENCVDILKKLFNDNKFIIDPIINILKETIDDNTKTYEDEDDLIYGFLSMISSTSIDDSFIKISSVYGLLKYSEEESLDKLNSLKRKLKLERLNDV